MDLSDKELNHRDIDAKLGLWSFGFITFPITISLQYDFITCVKVLSHLGRKRKATEVLLNEQCLCCVFIVIQMLKDIKNLFRYALMSCRQFSFFEPTAPAFSLFYQRKAKIFLLRATPATLNYEIQNGKCIIPCQF